MRTSKLSLQPLLLLLGLLVLGVPRTSTAAAPEDSPPDKERGEIPPTSESSSKHTGSLPKALIDKTVRSHLPRIRGCYEAGLTQDPSLGGKVVVAFVISSDGTVAEASVKESTVGAVGLRGLAVESCILSIFKEMRFPEPKGGGTVRVSYPFVFKQQKFPEVQEGRPGQMSGETLNIKKPSITYPAAARQLRVQGDVIIRILVDVDGTIVGNKDSRCTGFASARKFQRRRFWHPTLCISGKGRPLLRQYALRAWGTSEWKPWGTSEWKPSPAEKITPYFVNVSVRFRL